MERTPLQQEFFRRSEDDPYLRMIQKMWVDAYLSGYEEALHRTDSWDAHELSRSDVREIAVSWLTEKEDRADELVALATLGYKMEKLAIEVIERLMNPKLIAGIG
jgi:hypothetical protein